MGWTDSHGRPELKMHPDIKRGVAPYRREKPLGQPAPDTMDGTVGGSAAGQRSEGAAG